MGIRTWGVRWLTGEDLAPRMCPSGKRLSVRAPASRTGSHGGSRARWAATCDARKQRSPFSQSPQPPPTIQTERPRRTTRPGTRTLVGTPDRHPTPATTPHIGEHAAARGRVATEGGDEHAGAKRRYPFEGQPRAPDLERIPPKPNTRTQGPAPVAAFLGNIMYHRLGTLTLGDTNEGKPFPSDYPNFLGSYGSRRIGFW